MSRIYDISMPIRDGGVVYPGNPDIHIAPQQSVSAGAGANVSSIAFGSHTATHVDAPRHFIDNAASVDELPLDVLTGDAILLRFDDSVMAIGRQEIEAQKISGHSRVLLATRNSKLQRDEKFFPDYTYLAPDGAECLIELGVKLVGVDYLSVEQFHSGHHRTHLALLTKGVVIVEGLDLSEPAPGIYQLVCLPLRIAGCDGAPARAILLEPAAQ